MKPIFLAMLLIASSTLPFARPSDEALSLALLASTLRQTESEAVRESILRGMLKGLEGRRQVQTPAGWNDLSPILAGSSNAKVRDLSQQLAQVFGDVKATAKALSILKDRSAASESRRSSLRALLAQNNQEASDLLESLLDDREMSIDAIRGYATMENATAPSVLLDRYSGCLLYTSDAADE